MEQGWGARWQAAHTPACQRPAPCPICCLHHLQFDLPLVTAAWCLSSAAAGTRSSSTCTHAPSRCRAGACKMHGCMPVCGIVCGTDHVVQAMLLLSAEAALSPGSPNTDLVAICTALQARLELGPLARALNRIDRGRQAGMEWSASSLVDTGPILR